jgi:hypothetical protein
MFSSLLTLVDQCRLGRLGRVALVVLCLGLPGCTSCGLRGEGFEEDDFSKIPQQYRSTEKQGDAFAFSNKARQIERNFGYR